jgi:hypothetical protein
MKKLKKRLIHLLGGRILEEVNQECVMFYKMAQMDALASVSFMIDCKLDNTPEDSLKSIIGSIKDKYLEYFNDYYEYKNRL